MDRLGEKRNKYRILVMKYSLGSLRKRLKNNSKFAHYCVLRQALRSVGLTFWVPWFSHFCIIDIFFLNRFDLPDRVKTDILFFFYSDT